MKDDTTSESMQQAHELIERSCLVDSHHLYQITAGCLASSDAVSVCSEQSSRSFLGLRQRAAASQASTGLLELTRCVSNVQGGGCLEAGMGTSMTDSAISKDTATTSSVARTTNRSIMFDSAIGTDLVSSEDESCNAAISSSSLHHCSIAYIPSTSNPSIIRRTNLKLISEDQHSDQSISERSLEWFEDEFGDDDGEAFAESFAEFGIKSLGDGQGIAFDLDNAVRLNTSQAADCTPQTKAKAITSLDIPGCASSTNSPKLDIEVYACGTFFRFTSCSVIFSYQCGDISKGTSLWIWW
ncbi:unnamed protein product [Anisakis simplex]|uniref:Uncharacterized protein n=1 Tax=Anisakis simplex TaxID=6269 RepID=A0A0M3KBE5_ANISI|nr:unnamed protein product [Anisakis simplex]